MRTRFLPTFECKPEEQYQMASPDSPVATKHTNQIVATTPTTTALILVPFYLTQCSLFPKFGSHQFQPGRQRLCLFQAKNSLLG
jgi:hypothetical protein